MLLRAFPLLLVMLWLQPRAGVVPPAAEERFSAGVRWLHNFGYDEAIEEFQKAEALAPAFAMAYWGEAMAHYRPVWRIENLPAARAALVKLAPTPEGRLALAATPRETAYLEAAHVLFAENRDQPARHAAFAEAMRRIANAYPDDLNAPVFYAFSLIGLVPVGNYTDARLDQAGGVAEKVFVRDPQQPGAAHAIIHAYDDRDRAFRALPAALAYARLAPESSHARHMPAHIFVQLGRWDDAVTADEAAWKAALAHTQRRGLAASQTDFHPLSWLVYEYLQQGRFDLSRGALGPLEQALKADPKPWMVNELATWRAFYLVGSERWSEVTDRQKFDNADELFALGYAAARTRNLDKARAIHEVMKKVAATDSEPSRRELAAIMERQLSAAISAAAGSIGPALSAAREAAALEDKTPRSTGRPHPVKSSHELYGEILLLAGRPAEAQAQFARALWRVTNRSSSVLGLARAAAAAGDVATARKHYQQFLQNWSHADPTRPELAEARKGAR